MTERDSATITQEIRIAAHPETVFAFLTDPDKILRWKGKSATVDPRPGGIYRVDVDGRHIARGEYVEVVPNRRVVFTWGWEDEGNPVPPGSSTVEITLVPDGDGTILRLVHRGLPEGAREPHAQGWAHYLDRLAVAASGHDPGPDPWEDPEHAQGLCE
jgi:uncharacterized protein YndB with AHSA1/START domain